MPLIIVHPKHRGGQRTKAVTSHLDIAPTLVALTNAAPEKKAAIVKSLPGKDLSRLLAAPGNAGPDAVRDGMLFCYNMFAYIDGDLMARAARLMNEPDGRAKVQAAAKAGTLRPDLAKRGALRSVYDGRYTFTRYFSAKEHNMPRSMEALLKLNDVELFDSARDPDEVDNLARDPARHGDLMLAMNAKLNRLIETEVGLDAGQMLPGGIDGGWVATDAVKDV